MEKKKKKKKQNNTKRMNWRWEKESRWTIGCKHHLKNRKYVNVSNSKEDKLIDKFYIQI